MDNNVGMGFEGIIYLAIIAFMFGGFGGFGFGGNNAGAAVAANMATQNDVQRGFDNQNSMANQREILSAVTNGTAQAVSATNQTFHDTLGIIQNRYDELARDISGLAVGQAQALANQNECCCGIKQMIMQSNYDAALRDAATNANITAQVQSVKDMLYQNKIEAQAQRINQLELGQAMSGVLRFPNSWTFNAGQFPPFTVPTTTTGGTTTLASY